MAKAKTAMMVKKTAKKSNGKAAMKGCACKKSCK